MTKRPPVCRNCRGSRTTHSGPDGCWCRACLKLDEEARCRSYEPEDAPKPRVSAAHPEAAERATVVAALREGSMRKTMFHLVQLRQRRGYTDDELQAAMGKAHQTVAACRNGLVADGLLVDSGERRPTRYGTDAIVWIVNTNP